MSRLLKICLIGFFALLLHVVPVRSQDPPAGRTWPRYWVFFTDKGSSSPASLQKAAAAVLSWRSLQRRQLRATQRPIVDVSDAPVYAPYLEALRAMGIRIYRVSRWLNAASVVAGIHQLERVRQLPFVKKVQPVAVYRHRPVPDSPRPPFRKRLPAAPHTFDYGLSYDQVGLINIPKLHDLGYSGKGILITLIDTGFHYQKHRAFQSLNVVAEWDFINNDAVTRNEQGQDAPYQDFHGTAVLSIIGGFWPGKIIGPAYAADYALAKTEYVPTETRIEEDNWVAAVEWADSLGTDVISTSLGYRDFDDGFAYQYSDLDGRTMVTSKAATMAVEKGIVVVASAGNEGNNPEWPYITSPADGIGVIAAGAVDALGRRASFSSIGPTFDGRIKPDLMAMGVGNAFAQSDDSLGIKFGNGTSFSAPLIAGVCALLLEIHPNWTPAQVWEALTQTASRADNPDNFYGYGIVDAFSASQYLFPGERPEKFALVRTQLNLQNRTTIFFLDVPEPKPMKVQIFDALGRRVVQFREQPLTGKSRPFLWKWPANLASGVYFVRFTAGDQQITAKTLIVR
jgi:subtilisin family serine protease